MDDLENRILETAREAFIEKGYTDTSMSDIASRMAISRPTLNYYFRTKDKLFQAVFGSIIQHVVPRIREVIIQRQRPVGDRVADIVDLYYTVFKANPCLPSFVIREINRDVDHLIETLQALHIEDKIIDVVSTLEEEMAEGRIRQMPIYHIFYTFYGLLTFPFITKNLAQKKILPSTPLTTLLEDWKQNIVHQMEALLEP